MQPYSLHHTFPRFKLKGVNLRFLLVQSEDCHLDCEPSQMERSKSGLPYPKLEVFAQSLLGIQDRVALTDLVDGMDLTEEWGEEHLSLDGTSDILYAKRKNEKIRASGPQDDTWGGMIELPVHPVNLRETWQDIVRTKERRIGIECPKEFFATRFFVRGRGDPRLRARPGV